MEVNNGTSTEICQICMHKMHNMLTLFAVWTPPTFGMDPLPFRMTNMSKYAKQKMQNMNPPKQAMKHVKNKIFFKNM
jgi:hypothetical protein